MRDTPQVAAHWPHDHAAGYRWRREQQQVEELLQRIASA
jgi:hypothetical protein